MSGEHPELGPELRALAQSILDRIDPALRSAAALAASRAGANPGKCQQVWCPVCALAALSTGEEHPLLSVIAEHSVALLTVIRAMVDGTEAATTAAGNDVPAGDVLPGDVPAGDDPDDDDPGGGDGPGGQPSPESPGRYQHIPVTVRES